MSTISTRVNSQTAAVSNVLSAANSSDVEVSSQTSACASMKRILLVDDQAHVLRVMKLILDRNGYEVDTALSGDVALGMLHEYDYDVLITDADMPRMDGQQLCRQVQRQFADTAPLTFVIADNIEENTNDWIAEFPNTECLEKPVSLRWLVARLSEYFGFYENSHGA